MKSNQLIFVAAAAAGLFFLLRRNSGPRFAVPQVWTEEQVTAFNNANSQGMSLTRAMRNPITGEVSFVY